MNREEIESVSHYVENYSVRFDDGRSYTPDEQEKALLEDAIEGYLAALRASAAPEEGTVLMPREATHAMTMAGCDCLPSCEHVFGHAGELLRNAYRKMVEVAALSPDSRKAEPEGMNHRTTAEPDQRSGHRSAEDAAPMSELPENLTDHAKTLLRSLPREIWTESDDGQMLFALSRDGHCKYTRLNSTLGRFDLSRQAAPYSTIEEAEAEEIAHIIWIGWDDEWTDLVGEIQMAARRLHAMGYRKLRAASTVVDHQKITDRPYFAEGKTP